MSSSLGRVISEGGLESPSRTYTSGIITKSMQQKDDMRVTVNNRAMEEEGGEEEGERRIEQFIEENHLEEEEEKKIKFNTRRNKWRVFATCLWFFSIGWTDATAGTILVYIEDYYNISYALVSLIWLGNALGFITIALSSHELSNRLGFYKILVLSPILYVIMGAIISSGTKFPLIVVAYYFGGLGGAIGLSQFNVHLSRFDIASTILGLAHGSYGAGATLAPIIATLMTDSHIQWSYFYLFLTGFMTFNLIDLFFAYKGVEEELAELNSDGKKEVLSITESLKDLNTWLICFFILFYQGAEVALAGYIVSYLLDYRSGDKGTVGYVASGFWGGLTIGRFALTTVCSKKIGVRRSTIIMTILSIILIVLAWLVPNLILESVFISIAGIFIGPMYPMAIASLAKILPRKILVVSLSLSSLFGSTGGSLFPFIVGLVSQFRGSFIVLPFSIGLFVAMLLCWLGLPNIDRTNVKTWWERIV